MKLFSNLGEGRFSASNLKNKEVNMLVRKLKKVQTPNGREYVTPVEVDVQEPARRTPEAVPSLRKRRMPLEAQYSMILDHIRKHPGRRTKLSSFAQMLDVATATVRTRMEELENQGKIVRKSGDPNGKHHFYRYWLKEHAEPRPEVKLSDDQMFEFIKQNQGKKLTLKTVSEHFGHTPRYNGDIPTPIRKTVDNLVKSGRITKTKLGKSHAQGVAYFVKDDDITEIEVDYTDTRKVVDKPEKNDEAQPLEDIIWEFVRERESVNLIEFLKWTKGE